MNEILFPRTDAGVLAQIVALVVVTMISIWVSRRSKDQVMFVVGVFMITAAFLRGAHAPLIPDSVPWRKRRVSRRSGRC